MFKVFAIICISLISLQPIQTQIEYRIDILDDFTDNDIAIDLESLVGKDNAAIHNLQREEEIKYCRFRDHELLYPTANLIWRWLTCGNCFFYTDLARLNYRMPVWNYPLNFNNVTYTIIVTKVDNITFPFDYLNEKWMGLIKPVFKTQRFLEKFINCCKNAVLCCENYMNDENIYPTDEYPCAAVWDAWSCFPPAKAGEIAYMDCPEYATTSDDRACVSLSEKQCLSNGTWNAQTNYLPCASASIYRRRHGFHIDMLITSTVLVTPAIIILFIFPKLYILRLALHRNLMISIVVKNICTLIAKEIVIMDSLKPPTESNNVLIEDGVGCRALSVLENLSKNVIFMCMLVDGFYLHKMVVRAFSPEPTEWILYAVVAVLPVIPTVIWSALMGASGKGLCWMVDPDSWYQWIPDGFKYAILAINICMLIDILRVLILKFGKKSNTKHTKQTVKAILVLIPIFGIPLLITSQRNFINMDDCIAGDVFYYISYTVEALQGIVVAIVFCYLSKEVHREIKNAYRKYSTIFRERYGLRKPFKEKRRRTTAMTNVDIPIDVDTMIF